MADKLFEAPSGVIRRFKDMGDGTFAEVMHIEGVTIDGDVTIGASVEVSNDSGNPLPVVEGLSIPEHDHIALSYTGEDITGVTYKTGGADGTTVATLTLAYSDGKLTSVTRG
jgi:hypothetical protein